MKYSNLVSGDRMANSILRLLQHSQAPTCVWLGKRSTHKYANHKEILVVQGEVMPREGSNANKYMTISSRNVKLVESII